MPIPENPLNLKSHLYIESSSFEVENTAISDYRRMRLCNINLRKTKLIEALSTKNIASCVSTQPSILKKRELKIKKQFHCLYYRRKCFKTMNWIVSIGKREIQSSGRLMEKRNDSY
ncbi:hypothetical protein T265_00892 [Opisthorchis viverrini]|uniref:Uncharacterized protein n=1 Tax=Opisthorchis viverrini TaxID=6198 RepID=A0A075AJD5_OPIVI|nr:hypothetical protein T265_00892 [Opisthorchis viverrini]KER33194.1 hypothetical protein T265_00892 [Opisthorchis viverrini]